MALQTKLPKVGTNIFTQMSQLAIKHNAINLGQGFPDFDGPVALREALTKHMAEGRNQYSPMTGVPKLREQIAIKTKRLYGRDVNVDTEITVTSGATEALFAAIACVIDDGDEVIILDPCYDSYDPAITLNGGVPVHVPLHSMNFSVDWDRVKHAITPRTKMIITNTPHNPTGAVFSAADMAQLTQLAITHNLWVISDEVYEHIIFDGTVHQSASLYPELAERTFVISSFGKTFHCTGWKVGYCIAPAAMSAEFRKVHQYLTFCTFTPAQFALADILESQPEHYLELPAFYQAKRDRFQALLVQSKFRLLPVPGGYFQVVDYSSISDKPGREFAQWLTAEVGVASIPVSAFYDVDTGQKLIRFCFAKNDATMADAAQRLCAI